MNLSKKNLLIQYNNWIFEKYPTDICSLFWGSLFSILLPWLYVPGRLITNLIDYPLPVFFRGIIFYFCLFVITLIGVGVNKENNLGIDTVWGCFFLGVGICLSVAIGIALFIGIIVLCYMAGDRYSRSRVEAPVKVKTYPVRDWWAAIRGKYCTKITYTDESN